MRFSLRFAIACVFAMVTLTRAADAPASGDPPSAELTAGANDQMRFVLIGPMPNDAPKDGYHLLLILPGGDGSADFRPFCTNLLKQALPPTYLVAELIAPKWRDGNDRIVWPTEKLRDEKMKFTTEEFMDAVVAEVQKKQKVDPKHVYALGWSSGGPPVYAAAMREKTPITGAFVAMSVFKPEQLPPLKKLDGRAFHILHSPQDFIPMRFPEAARDTLKKAGAVTQLTTYEGGHGWHGDVFGSIRAGIEWLEKNSP